MIDYAVALDALPDPLPVAPLEGRVEATISPPGSKSLTCRAYVLAALAEGASRLVRPLLADDTDRLLAALETLGARIERDGDDVTVEGVGGRFPRGGEVNLGDGGAPSRFILACACLAEEPVVVDGSPRLRQRPVAELVELLRGLGAEVAYADADGRLPVRVTPTPRFRGGTVSVGTTRSSQFISALLLVAPFLARGLEIRFEGPVTSRSYVELTLAALRACGLRVDERDGRLSVPRQMLRGQTLAIPPDASSAVPWWTAAALRAGWSVRIPGLVGAPFQPDEAYPRCLALMGAEVGREAAGGSGVGATVVRGGAVLRAPLGAIDMSLCPDAALSLAALAARAHGRTTISGLRTLKVKETDRIAALAAELGRLGCSVETTRERLAVDPASGHERPAVIETYRDHRMAMAFAVLGLVRGGISIRDPACVAKSYPGFWRDLGRLYDEQGRS